MKTMTSLQVTRFVLMSLVVYCAMASPVSDTELNKEISQVTNYLGLIKNSYQSNTIGRSEGFLDDKLEEYVKNHDARFDLPLVGSTVTLGTSNLDQDELDIKVKFSDSSEMQARKKSKIKKILLPILVFVLLKAMTLVPLALGVLGIKAWNALQLSFFSFLISVSLAVFQLCKKLAGDHGGAQIVAHNGWEPHYKRSLDVGPQADKAQEMAYSAYRQ